jgi:hypothetical protein
MLHRVRVACLSLIVALLIGGLYSSSYSDTVATQTPTAPILKSVKIDIPPDVRIQAAQQALEQWIKDVNILIQQNHGIVDSNIVQYASEELEHMKNSRFIISASEGILSRANIYIFALSLFGSAFFDYLMEKLQSGEIFANIPSASVPAGCQSLPYYCPNGSAEQVWSSPWYTCDDGVYYCVITGWTNLGDGTCSPSLDCIGHVIKYCDASFVYNPMYDSEYSSESGIFIQGQSPESFLPCKGATPQVDNKVVETAIATIPTAVLSDVAPLNINSDGSISPVSTSTFEINAPSYSPDGVISSSLSTPYPDFYLPSGALITFTDDSGNQTQITTGDNSNTNFNTGSNTGTYTGSNTGSNTGTDNNTNNNTNTDTYTPSDADLDTSVNVPQKKDIATLITSFIQSLKNKFTFNSSCGSGNCSFSIDVFGKPATIDFCQFGDAFSMIGTIILTFSYFYAFFIVAKGD